MDYYTPTEADRGIVYNSLLALSQTDNIEEAADIFLDTIVEAEDVDVCGFYFKHPSSSILELISERNATASLLERTREYDLEKNPAAFQMILQDRPVYRFYHDLLNNQGRGAKGVSNEELRAVGIIPMSCCNDQALSCLSIISKGHDQFVPRTKWLAEKMSTNMCSTIKRIIDEETLGLTRKDFESLFQLSTNMLFICNMQGNILDANVAAVQKLGYTQDELRDMRLVDIHPPEMREEMLDKFDDLVNNKENICNIPCITKEHELISTYSKIMRGNWHGINVLIVEVVDISNLIERDMALSYRQMMENTIASVSDILASEDANFEDILKRLGDTMKADRAYIFKLRDSMQRIDNTNEWCANGIETQMPTLQDVESSMFPWWMRQLETGKAINIANVEQMPMEAYAEREMMREQNIKSIMVVPINSDKELVGFIGFDQTSYFRLWREDDMALLKVVSRMIGNYFKRERMMEMIIKEKNEALSKSQALEEFTAMLYHDMQSPLVTLNAYMDYLGEAIEDHDSESVNEFMGVIKRSVSEISKNSRRLGDKIRIDGKEAVKSK